jgi:peptide chain release factor 2
MNSEIHEQAKQLKVEFEKLQDRLKIDELSSRKKILDEQITRPDFWSDSQRAQRVSKEQAELTRRTSVFEQIGRDIEDVIELSQLGDDKLSSDLSEQLEVLKIRLSEIIDENKFSGPYDQRSVILSIFAGAGGTDAQDWAQMLTRMYKRWADNHKYKITMLDESPGEEAGIKSITMEVSGPLAYGNLRGENGVHRLVRLSPFNADNLRQTSFAKVEIIPEIDQPDELNLDDKDLRIDVYRSGGHGGQSVNTTDSAVRVTHLPTGISVAIQNERSQLQNKETALTILRSKLLQLKLEQHQDELSQIKGPNKSAEWGNQIRSYVLHPYKQVKDLRTQYETSDIDKVLNGDIDEFIKAYADSLPESS